MALTNRQRAFIEHYLQTWNASESARRAGYLPKHADVTGPRLLGNVGIAAEIKRRLSELQMGTDEILQRLTAQARGSMADFIDIDTGQINLPQAREAGKLGLLKSYKVTQRKLNNAVTVETITLEIHDAQAALALLGRARGMFVDRSEHTGKDGAPIETRQVHVSVYLPDNGRGDGPDRAGASDGGH